MIITNEQKILIGLGLAYYYYNYEQSQTYESRALNNSEDDIIKISHKNKTNIIRCGCGSSGKTFEEIMEMIAGKDDVEAEIIETEEAEIIEGEETEIIEGE